MALAEYGNAFNIDVDGSGNPILADAESGGTVAIYDRASGSWQIDAVEANTVDSGSVNSDSADVANNVEAGSADVLGALTADSADVANNVEAGSADVLGALTATDATVTNGPTDPNDVAIKEYVDSVAQGLDWQDSVIDEQNDPPASPATGDRYLVGETPTGAWDTHAEEIAEWDGSAWEFFVPNEGWSVFIENIDLLEVYNGVTWVAFGSAIDHGTLAGLSDDDHTQYVLADGTRSFTGSIEINNNTIAQSVVATGSVTLTDGVATVDTGVTDTDATFQLALGANTNDAKVAGRLFLDSTDGRYKVEIVEDETDVGNPSVDYDVVRVR